MHRPRTTGHRPGAGTTPSTEHLPAYHRAVDHRSHRRDRHGWRLPAYRQRAGLPPTDDRGSRARAERSIRAGPCVPPSEPNPTTTPATERSRHARRASDRSLGRPDRHTGNRLMIEIKHKQSRERTLVPACARQRIRDLVCLTLASGPAGRGRVRPAVAGAHPPPADGAGAATANTGHRARRVRKGSAALTDRAAAHLRDQRPAPRPPLPRQHPIVTSRAARPPSTRSTRQRLDRAQPRRPELATPGTAMMATCRTAVSASTWRRCASIRVIQRSATVPDGPATSSTPLLRPCECVTPGCVSKMATGWQARGVLPRRPSPESAVSECRLRRPRADLGACHPTAHGDARPPAWLRAAREVPGQSPNPQTAGRGSATGLAVCHHSNLR
jgi:hypothetical protein